MRGHVLAKGGFGPFGLVARGFCFRIWGLASTIQGFPGATRGCNEHLHPYPLINSELVLLVHFSKIWVVLDVVSTALSTFPQTTTAMEAYPISIL